MLLDEVQRRTGTYIHPWFECNRGATVVRKTVDVTPSFREYHARQVVQDVKQWMCFVPHNPIVVPAEITDAVTVSRLREEELQRRLLHFPPPYELPDGTLVHSGESICTVPERVFFPFPGSQQASSAGSASASSGSRKRTRDLLDATFPAGFFSSSSDAQSSTSYPSDSLMAKLGARADQESLADLVYACVAHADPDVRKELLGNIQLVGGGALIQGLSNRLTYELNSIVPTHMKVRTEGFERFTPHCIAVATSPRTFSSKANCALLLLRCTGEAGDGHCGGAPARGLDRRLHPVHLRLLPAAMAHQAGVRRDGCRAGSIAV
jgi:hypothetical protein